jgi:hypothetical protein
LHINTGANGNIIQANGSDVGWDFILKGTNDADTNSFLYEMGMYRADGTTNPNTVLKFGRGDNVQNGFFAIDQNGSEAMRIDSSGNVGIGTTSPAKTFVVSDGGNLGVEISPDDNSTGQSRIISYDRGTNAYKTLRVEGEDIRLLAGNPATERMRIDSSGNVGIGTTSPARTLSVNGAAGFGNGTIETIISYSDRGIFGTQSNHSLELRTNGTERMRIDSSGNVGINVTDPIYPLEVQGEAGIEIYNGTGGGDVLNFRPSLGDANKYNLSISSYDHSGGGVGPADGLSINGFDGVSIATGSSTTRQERLRIDASGNLLVGTTSTDTVSSSGFTVQPDGQIFASSESQQVATLTRRTDDGEIMRFRKDGTTVGSIKTISGDSIGIGTGVTGLRFISSTNRIQPVDISTGLNSDGLTDLGDVNKRFQDLYLSGGVYLGGTTTANKLDDYETGTWTPVLSDALSGGNVATATSLLGIYTKVGNIVTVTLRAINITTTGMTAGNDLVIQGLPFNSNGSFNHIGSVATSDIAFSGQLGFYGNGGTATAKLSDSTTAAGIDYTTVADLTSGNADIQGIITYQAG